MAAALLAAHYKRPLQSLVALFQGSLRSFMREPDEQQQRDGIVDEYKAAGGEGEEVEGVSRSNDDILRLVHVLLDASLQRRPQERSELPALLNHLGGLVSLPSSSLSGAM